MREKLLSLLAASASPEATTWLRDAMASLSEDFDRRRFYFDFSGVSRRFDKHALVEVPEETARELDREVPGFAIEGWDQYRLARVALLLALGDRDREEFLAVFDTLRGSADLREQTALYSALPLLPHQEDLVEHAIDGLRTNIVDVFDAIALENPYPSNHFSDEAWNQMVLKALFIERPLYRIYGIDYRANLPLAEALSNLAHERWAAGRWVSPELWRSCANFLTDQIIEDLARVAATEEGGCREAVALIVSVDEEGKLEHLRDHVKTFLDDVADGRLTWDTLGEQI